uniref:Chondroadherin-like protein n=1 Tax=Stegastes partitus TaxID=144197 RepID=A0A3B5APV6_9TELE
MTIKVYVFLTQMRFFCAAFFLLLSTLEAKKCPKECSCDGTQLTVACVDKNLTEIPPSVDEITLKLDLRNNNLQVLPRGAFTHTPYLTHLNLQRCNIIKVKEGAFRTLGRVVSLNLAHNKIDILYQESFDGLSSLKELHLDHNRIEEIQPGAFTQLGFLNMLTLSHNQLVYIPNMAFQGLHNINWLRLSHNSLNNLAPEAFAGLFTLNRLSLDHNELQFFPTQTMTSLNLTGILLLLPTHVGLLNYLHHLAGGVELLGACAGPPHLSDEPLQAVAPLDLRCRNRAEAPKEEEEEKEEEKEDESPTNAPSKPTPCSRMKACFCSQHATCEDRGHTKVPRGFPAKTELLDLRSNHFHHLPASSFPGSSQVVSLHLEFCKIREIENGAFQGMKNLFYLYLSDNDLTFLDPRVFAGTPQLTYLHLEGNRLVQFPGSALSLLPSLFVLHMERNAISKLEPTGLLSSTTPRLRELYLSNNTITVIAKGALDSATLSTLHLDSNQLTEVPTQALSEAPSLEELNLSQNSVRRVGPKAFQPVHQSLKRLYMDHTGMEKMSSDALLGLGSGLRALTVRGNQLEELPDLSPLTGLDLIDLRDNPLLCDCPLLPLRRWMEKVSLEVIATCGRPPELRGQKVTDVHVFTSCPEIMSPPGEKVAVDPKPPKTKKSKPSKLSNSPGVKAWPERAKAKVAKPAKKQPQRKPVTPKKTKNKKTLS